MKKFMSLMLVLLMAVGLSVSAFALNVDSGLGGSATVTVSNAAKGENYKIYKLFDATVSGEDNGSIAYTGDIPESLMTFFEKDESGNVYATAAAGAGTFSAEAVAAITAWAATAAPIKEQVADGSVLNFINLPYGMYVVTTTQGSVITVDSTNPSVTVVDKNVTTPNVEKLVNSKPQDSVSIGDTVTYTASFPTANWLLDDGEGAIADGLYHKVVKYVIADTLPDFLSDVTVTGLVIDNDPASTEDAQVSITPTPAFDGNRQITIPWVDADGNHLYDNGAVILLTYTAKLNSAAVVDGTDGNVNTISITPYVDDDDTPWDEHWENSSIIYTYAALLKKVDENKAPLAGAEFAANGLLVEGDNGNYTVVSYDPSSTTLGTTMKCDGEGRLYISGLAEAVVLTVTETKAPDGYNKLVDTVEMRPVKIGEVTEGRSVTVYYDADGNVTDTETDSFIKKVEYNVNFDTEGNFIQVENAKGLELPSTGGIGTTVFYVLGGVLMLGAVIVLASKRRLNKDQ